MMTSFGSWRLVNSRMVLISDGAECPVVCDRLQPHWVLGESAGRRVADYRAAAQRCGMQMPGCVDWIEFINNGSQVLSQMPTGSRLRIDSFGDSDEVLAALIQLGGGSEFPQRGEIRSLDYQHLGLCRALRELDHWVEQRPDLVLDQEPSEIEVMFDKWATHHRMLPHRPETILLPTELGDLETCLKPFIRDCRGRVFIKPRYGSSASGVCCYRVCHERQQLIAPIEIERERGQIRLFNSLCVRSYIDPRDIQDIFSVLIPQGMIAEAAVNKARIEGDRFDLRVVVIDKRADHIVARQSASPITNLHLGNRRAAMDMVIDAVGVDRLAACREMALLAASCFPGTLYCGIDILLPQHGDPLVCEVNAFGDFLPNLVANGRSVYEAILRADSHRRQVLA